MSKQSAFRRSHHKKWPLTAASFDTYNQGSFLLLGICHQWLTSLSAESAMYDLQTRTHSETQFICSIPHERGALLRWNHSMKKAIALTRYSVRAVRFSPVHWYHPFWLQYSTINLKWQDGKLYKTNSFRWCNSMNSMCGHWQSCENLIYLF